MIYQDDAAGHAVLDSILRAISKHQVTPVSVATFAHYSLEVDQAVKTVREAKPEAVIIAGPYAPLAAILKKAHATGWNPLFLSLSAAGTEGLIRAAGSDAEGVIITQVVPPYDRTDLPTIKLYREALEKYMGGVPAQLCQSGRIYGCDGRDRGAEASRKGPHAGKIHQWHRVDPQPGCRTWAEISP